MEGRDFAVDVCRVNVYVVYVWGFVN
jgi:hypothetical protein